MISKALITWFTLTLISYLLLTTYDEYQDINKSIVTIFILVVFCATMFWLIIPVYIYYIFYRDK